MASKVLFDRKWKIVLTTDTNTWTIRELKVMFNIRNTLLGDPSLASFQIYNIGSVSEGMLTDSSCILSFYAGYNSDNENSWDVLFSGKVTNSYSIRQSTDVVWNVWARHASVLLTKTYPSLSPIQNATSIKSLIASLASNAEGLKGTPTYTNSCDTYLDTLDDVDEHMFTGTFEEEFNDLLLSIGFGWYVQNYELIIFNQADTDPGSSESSIEVSNLTGLLDIPVVDYTGVHFTSLLNGKYKPTKIINIAPNTVRYNLGNEYYVERYDKTKWRASGKFRIYEVTHKGDTRGDSWDSEITAFYRRN